MSIFIILTYAMLALVVVSGGVALSRQLNPSSHSLQIRRPLFAPQARRPLRTRA